MKLEGVEQPAETALLLAELINRGLATNDRLKYYLTPLQASTAHAERPQLVFPNLRNERLSIPSLSPPFPAAAPVRSAQSAAPPGGGYAKFAGIAASAPRFRSLP